MEKINEIIGYIQGIEIGQIINLIISLAVIILILIFSPMITYGILKIVYRKESKGEIKNGNLYKSLRLLINLLAIFIGIKILNINAEQEIVVNKCFRIVVIWSSANIISGIFEAKTILIRKKYKDEAITKKDEFIANFISKCIKIVLYLMSAYLTLKEFNFDLGGLAAGLGFGGAILALAAQDLVKQAFDGLSILVDKPFEIGDWIEVGENSGTVEGITMRTTKIRTVEDTIVTMENNKIISSNVVNWGKINKRVYKSNLKLALETEEGTVEKLLSRIRFILKYNKDIIKESISVQFNKIEKDGINISIYVETIITKYADYQSFCNKLNLTLLNILETQGVKLSYPGQNIYIKENVDSKLNDLMKSEKNKLVKPVKIENKKKEA